MVLSNTYEEVYQMLKHMNKATVMKIPNNVLNNIIKNRNSNFKTNIDTTDLFNQENVSKEAIDLLSWIAYNYLLDNEKKQKIDKINQSFYIEVEKEKLSKYNPNDIFKNHKKQDVQKKSDKNVSLILYNENIFTKLLKKILKIFKF